MPARTRVPKSGYARASTAAALWAPKGSLARFLLNDHMPPARLAELRSLGTFVVLAAALALTRPRLLKINTKDIGRLTFFGVVGLAGVNALYFAAIARLNIGVAVTIQYLGPLLLLVWLKLVHRRALPGGLWSAAGLAAIGCFFVVRAYHPGGLDRVGVAVGAAPDPSLGARFAGPSRNQALRPVQAVGGLVVVGAVIWVQAQRPALEAERAPAYGAAGRARARVE